MSYIFNCLTKKPTVKTLLLIRKTLQSVIVIAGKEAICAFIQQTQKQHFTIIVTWRFWCWCSSFLREKGIEKICKYAFPTPSYTGFWAINLKWKQSTVEQFASNHILQVISAINIICKYNLNQLTSAFGSY